MSRPQRIRHLAAILVLAVGGAPVAAQIDYRNLDVGRPVRVTDAYPVERFAFEFSLPYAAGRGLGAASHTVSPHLEYGIYRNLMVGVGVEVDLHRTGGSAGLAAAEIGALWNLRRETPSLPALALSLEVAQPLRDGRFGRDAAVTLTGLATRSIGRSRLHLNGVIGLLVPEASHLGTPWWAGLAWDRTLFRTSTLIVAEVVVNRDAGALPVNWSVGAGLRRQLTPTVVGAIGVAQALDALDAGTSLSVSLSHAFAIRSLMRRGAR